MSLSANNTAGSLNNISNMHYGSNTVPIDSYSLYYPHNNQNQVQPNVNTYTTISSSRASQDIYDEVAEVNKNMEYMKQFLIMKGIIKDEQEFNDFVNAMKVAEKLSDK